MMPSTLQSMLVPAGSQAAAIEWLWWLMFWTTAAVFVAVVVALVMAVFRRRGRNRPDPTPRTMAANVGIAAAISFAMLVGLLGASVVTGRTVSELDDPDPLLVQITGHQWWWQVDYWPVDPVRRVSDANEVHVPTGRVVALTLTSDDVIHSFWVPALHGKMDLIPGRKNTLRFRADQPGRWTGQCAEYCGLQHAHMRLVLIAHEPAEFERWLAAAAAPASDSPASDATARGRAIVVQGPCAMCHAISGTLAGGHTAPDLTHLASRQSIAAGTLPNTPDALSSWIRDPQAVKPGTRMPRVNLSDADRDAVVAFLRQLK